MKLSKRNRYSLLLSLVLLGAGALYVGWIYNQEAEDTHKIPTVASLTIKELTKPLRTENKKELDRFINKAIEVQGTIEDITFRKQAITLLLKDKTEDHLVLCQLHKDISEKELELKIGDTARLKGIYKGALMDVILLHCIILDAPTYE